VRAETEAAWSERVEEWRRSGKTAEEFAADKPYKGSTLQWAASRLRATPARKKRRQVSGTCRGDRTAEIQLAKVVRRAPPSEPAALSIEVAGACIAVRLGFDPALLRAVVRALKEER
jgi:transposase